MYYQLKVLKSFRHKDKKMRRRNIIFDERDNRYARRLIGYKLVEVKTIVHEKSKAIYSKKVIEPSKDKKKAEPKKINPVTSGQFKTKDRAEFPWKK